MCENIQKGGENYSIAWNSNTQIPTSNRLLIESYFLIIFRFDNITDNMTGAGGAGGGGLEEIGIPGRDYLREALTSCTDPLKAIEDFQVILILSWFTILQG